MWNQELCRNAVINKVFLLTHRILVHVHAKKKTLNRKLSNKIALQYPNFYLLNFIKITLWYFKAIFMLIAK